MSTETAPPSVLEKLSDEECYLWTILQDHSGLDTAEFLWQDPDADDGCFRAWPFQWTWWRCNDPLQIDQAARSVGKSLSIRARAFAFPFVFPGSEMLITAPELVHLEPIINSIETQVMATRLTRELIPRSRSAITHRPFMLNFANGARIMGRIPQRDGRGVKGAHPRLLEMDEAQDYPKCLPHGTLVLTKRGYVPIELVRVGDKVLTHRRRWRTVLDVQRTRKQLRTVIGHGHPGLGVSDDHKLWTLRERAGYTLGDPLGDGFRGLRLTRLFDAPEWVRAAELGGRDYWASPTRFPKVTSPPSCVRIGGRRSGHHVFDVANDDFLWLLGLYLADGSVLGGSTPKGVEFSCHDDEAPYVAKVAKNAGFSTSLHRSNGAACTKVVIHNPLLADYLVTHCGRGAFDKQVPVWVYGLRTRWRRAVLEGATFGDGFMDPDPRYAEGRWKLSTVGKALAASIKTLATTLGYSVSWYWVPDDRERTIRGRMFRMTNGGWYQVVGNAASEQVIDHWLHRWQRVRTTTPTGQMVDMVDLVVEEDHSFVAESIVVHNSGWTELIETLKRGDEGSVWRAHGVTRGVRDKFYDFTQESPDNEWTVHRVTAMARPNWTDQERQEKIKQYGSRDDPDYRRNILGLHGDATNPLFVLHRLMRCVDHDQSSEYNLAEYFRVELKDSELEEAQKKGLQIEDLLEFPMRHKSMYSVFWIGMDVGLTTDPTEIIILAEYHPAPAERKADKAAERSMPAEGVSRLKVIGRISLKRISHPHQVRAVLHIIDFYRPKSFAMDKTGIGLNIYQDVQDRIEAAADEIGRKRALEIARTIRGYNFGEKVLVDIDETKELDDHDDVDEVVKEAGISRNVLEYSTDKLREYVDESRLLLPWDRELIGEFQGQTFTYSKATMDSYGRRRRIFSEGKFHALDGSRMAIMGHAQSEIEAFVEKPKDDRPVLDVFVTV